MSFKVLGSKRGEWLELTPGKIFGNGTLEERIVKVQEWLTQQGMPLKLINLLSHTGGIKIAGDRLRLHLFPAASTQYEDCADEAEILYEDDFCLVVHKPIGIKIHSDGGIKKTSTLDDRVASIFIHRNEPIAPQHIHRLDEFTSGPVIYAKNQYAQLKLDEAMSRKEIGRRYVAFVEGKVDPTLTKIDQPIGKDRHHPKRQRVSPNGKVAITHVELLEASNNYSKLALELETGRTHQIRVHLSAAGHPLVGDELYGGDTAYLPYQALHGISLSFLHPWSGESITINDPLPEALIQLQQQLGINLLK
jgi:23S rRNA pseudouridine1911/1915/1917 synthase